jgi:multimeric flavodoxin WrbA
MSKIKLLGICGSPRKNKSSRFMLEEALEAARAAAPELVETELYSISTKTFHGCDACYQCEKLGHCRKIDDDFGELRDKWLAADAVIYSVPVYHMGIPAQLKGFIDRLGHSVQETFNDRAMKVMGFLSTGDGFASGQESVMYFLNNHAIMLGCIPIGGLWPVGYIGIGGRVPYGTTLRKMFDDRDEHAVEAIEATRELSKQIVLVTRLLKSGGEQNRDLIRENGGFHFFLQRLDYD